MSRWPPRSAAAGLVATGPAALLAGALAAPLWPQEPQAEQVFTDEISVELLTLTVRVVDRDGEPLAGLAPEDFLVRHRRRELPVVAVDWVDVGGGALAAEPGAEAAPRPGARPAPQAGGRTIFWLQSAVHPLRVVGLFKFLPHLEELLADLPASEQVAVLSFDSHLKLWQDFTRSRELVEQAFEDAVYFGKSPRAEADLTGELGARFDRRAAKRAATPEEALRITARALVELPGEKTLVLVGWGMGRYTRGGYQMGAAYPEARDALDASRTSVFVLDISGAEFHTLELGLQQLARNTGGSYQKTLRSPSQAIRRLARTLSGHHRLTVDISARPETEPRRLEVRLVDKEKGRVLARTP